VGVVALHVAGASALVVAVLRFNLGLYAYTVHEAIPAEPPADAISPSPLIST
jgi:hypothetical protein